MILPSWSLLHLSQDGATVRRSAPGEGAADGGTVIELAHKWVASRVKSGDLTKGSAAVVRCNLRSFVGWLPPAVERPEQLTRRHVERWLESMDGLSPSTRAGRLSAVRGWCEWLVIEKRMATDVTAGFRVKRPKSEIPRALSRDDVAALLADAPDARCKLMILLMVQEGLRCLEVSGLMAHDLDLRRRTAAIRGKGGAGKITRVVPLSAETMGALKNYLPEVSGPGPLIRSQVDPTAGVTPQTVSRIVGEVFTSSGVKYAPRDGRSPHALRHTAATDMIDGGAEMRSVQKILGHSSIAMTEHYTAGAVSDLVCTIEGRTYAIPA
jgi:site-specific recombinase XerD